MTSNFFSDWDLLKLGVTLVSVFTRHVMHIYEGGHRKQREHSQQLPCLLLTCASSPQWPQRRHTLVQALLLSNRVVVEV